MNKKLIRLTEQDLHRIVKESVNRVINEIGDTPKGQYMLGSLAARQNYGGINIDDPDDIYGYEDSQDMFNTLNYAQNERRKHPEIEDELQDFHDLGFEDNDEYCVPRIGKRKGKQMRKKIGI